MFISRKDAVTIEVIGFFGYSHDKRLRCIMHQFYAPPNSPRRVWPHIDNESSMDHAEDANRARAIIPLTNSK
jgi:hypothetical protein